MADETSGPVDLPKLLALLRLDSVDLYEMSGRVEAGFGSTEETGVGPDQQEQLELNVGPALRIRSDGLDVRCRLTVRTPEGEIVVDGAAFYNSEDPLEVDHDLAIAFADNVGIMALIPYLRQAVDDLSTRLLFPNRIVLPLLPRGAITFGHIQPDQVARVNDQTAE